MSVDAPVAKAMRIKLKELGVKTPHIWGKEKITLAIRSSAKLRALVPQVYGLGDLSSILDERTIAQTSAILEDWRPKLKAYVSTNAHVKAVRALDEHGAVLLLGNPSSGKSTIGAILSTMATENVEHSVIQISSPQEFIQHWNPTGKGRFFWIDDAFGSNIVSEDYTQQWASNFSKIAIAIKRGNRFLFTSRKHIYNVASPKLGNRNLQMFSTGVATVNVGDLSKYERKQILYNHIKFGDQSNSWKAKVKLHLEAVASVSEFLPGIAERLGKTIFTKTVRLDESSLCKFMAEPRDHLSATINELDSTQYAALVMIYVHQGKFNPAKPDAAAKKAVIESLGVEYPKINSLLKELEGSFTKSAKTEKGTVWAFEHPTISDAITDILMEQEHMTDALIRGAPIKTVMLNFACEDTGDQPDIGIIPKNLEQVMTGRLKTVPDKIEDNRILFNFLASRANEEMTISVLKASPDIFSRIHWHSGNVEYDPMSLLAAKAHRFGILPEENRYFISQELMSSALNEFDLSFLTSESLMALMRPKDLLELGMELRKKITNDMEAMLDEIQDTADMDDDPDSQFELIRAGLGIIEEIYERGNYEDSVFTDAYEAIETEVRILTEKQEEHRQEIDDEEEWEFHTGSQIDTPSVDIKTPIEATRSIFHDLDK